MSKIAAIGTALPPYRHRQEDILRFMLEAFGTPETDKRKISLMYQRSGIRYRYSVMPDYSVPCEERIFYPATKNLEPFPMLEKRMEWYHAHATELSIRAIRNCIRGRIRPGRITHLITVSCTGLSAPGLDISILQHMKLAATLDRTSVNFMGCYAAIHALKMAHTICTADPSAVVMIVCTELCTLHFQKTYEMDHIASSLLFGDGAAAVLVTGREFAGPGLEMKNFYAEVALNGISDMAWNVSGKGFLMTLSAYIPQLVGNGIEPLLKKALKGLQMKNEKITHWAIHPGGKKILDTIMRELHLPACALRPSYETLLEYGNMSSPTVLFVLKKILAEIKDQKGQLVFAAAFGPGLTLESLILQS